MAVTKPLIICLLDFSKKFTMEYNASGNKVGVVLIQGGRPIAYMSKALKGRIL